MKILQTIPTLGVGGAELFVLRLSKQLMNQGHEVKVVSFYSKEHAMPVCRKAIEEYGIPVTYLNKHTGIDLSILRVLKEKLDLYKPDIVHTHTLTGLYLLVAKRLYGGEWKQFHTVHSLAQQELPCFHRAGMRYGYKKGHIVPIAISDAVKKSICQVYGLKERQVECIYNGVELDRFKPKAKQCCIDDRIKLIHVGSFTEVKNHALLIEAFARACGKVNKNLYLTLVGDGPLKIQIEQMVASRGLKEKVEFIGNTPDVARYLQAADIFIMPSRYEGLPLAMLEAMATGLPVIATAVGGITDIVKANGLLCHNGDADGLADAIVCLAQDNRLREQMGRLSVKESVKYDFVKTAQNYILRFNGVLTC